MDTRDSWTTHGPVRDQVETTKTSSRPSGNQFTTEFRPPKDLFAHRVRPISATGSPSVLGKLCEFWCEIFGVRNVSSRGTGFGFVWCSVVGLVLLLVWFCGWLVLVLVLVFVLVLFCFGLLVCFGLGLDLGLGLGLGFGFGFGLVLLGWFWLVVVRFAGLGLVLCGFVVSLVQD